jgi:6-pyruvoyltetrahydropterin/6-carboxytetrahydropterin synthase
MEVAHRLFELTGKCENIHGHSMWVELKLHGQINKKGILDGWDFAEVKRLFRDYLDGTYDHQLLLNQRDPFAGILYRDKGHYATGESHPDYKPVTLPGLQTMNGDPTTENLAKRIAEWSVDMFQLPADVIVHETAVNAAGYSARPAKGGGFYG